MWYSGCAGSYVLRAIGYRPDTPTLEEMMSDYGETFLEARCTSPVCASKDKVKESGKVIKVAIPGGVTKQVPRGTETCPDCGYFLVWKRVGKKEKP
jgi:hypothetical protein